MFRGIKLVRLLPLVLIVLLVVGLAPLTVVGWLLSDRSAENLRAVEGRYQAELVQDTARHIELYAQRYREVVAGLARAFELAGGVHTLNESGADSRLQKVLQDDPNVIALAILPVQGEPHRAFQPDLIKREEVDERVEEMLAKMNGRAVLVGRPQIIRSGQEMGLTIASPVMGGKNGDEVVAAVVVIVSFHEVFAAVSKHVGATEKEMLEAGLPVVFVVDDQGRTVAHPDERIAFSGTSMTDLKVVTDWLERGEHVQSELAPFSVVRDGREEPMLGSYATADLGSSSRLGVISIQDERAALQSVREMRRQVFWISLVAAILATAIGVFFAGKLTRPVKELAGGAQRIAAGDFSKRIPIRSRTEIGELGHSFNLMTDQVEKFIGDLKHAATENRELFLGTVKGLAAAIDGKDPYTRGHSGRVAKFSVAIAEGMGLEAEEVEKIRISALLHDVGKIGIDDNILKKPSALTADEFEAMKRHPQKGYKIMAQIPAMREFLPGMYMHHEMINGAGYPQGLKGDEIPMQARIISVADTFDAMTTDRPYQKGMKLDEALKLIKGYVGTRYDERVVAALVSACEKGAIRVSTMRHMHEPVAPSAVPPSEPQVVATLISSIS